MPVIPSLGGRHGATVKQDNCKFKNKLGYISVFKTIPGPNSRNDIKLIHFSEEVL